MPKLFNMTEKEFYEVAIVKHPADLSCGDRVLVETKHPLSGDHGHEYEEGVCYGHCGDDMFIRLDSGKRMSVTYKGDRYKIIGKQIEVSGG